MSRNLAPPASVAGALMEDYRQHKFDEVVLKQRLAMALGSQEKADEWCRVVQRDVLRGQEIRAGRL